MSDVYLMYELDRGKEHEKRRYIETFVALVFAESSQHALVKWDQMRRREEVWSTVIQEGDTLRWRLTASRWQGTGIIPPVVDEVLDALACAPIRRHP